jgi:enoyl-[acyl-carrier-protein] reductase (NADH)
LPSSKDVGKLCLFLASSNSSSITGQCINLDSGVIPS